uniref:Secreted protein n=1 Tax=Setaria italica TaxID=4555 RepID=K3Z217_SETIT
MYSIDTFLLFLLQSTHTIFFLELRACAMSSCQNRQQVERRGRIERGPSNIFFRTIVLNYSNRE